ncbi:MAG: DUF89 domain-containing protein [Promethearchaeota archaeon]
MKVKSDCLYCLYFRAKKQIERLTTDEELRFNALVGVIQIISNHVSSNASEKIPHPLRLCPSYIGTKRDRFLQNIFQVDDTYNQEKANLKARTNKIWHMIQNKVNTFNSPEKQFELALALATGANIIEYDLLGHENEFNIEEKIQNIFDYAERDWDEFSVKLLPIFFSEIAGSTTILYLTDNVGEAIFDLKVIDILIQQGKKVIVAGKSKPILNDATVSDLQDFYYELKLTNPPEIVSIGTNSVGLLLDEVSNEFREIIRRTDLIIAKGMGHFETIPEYNWDQSIWCLFRSKCRPVTKEANSEIQKNCIRKIA